ncbi:carboxymuconolactone decarboxylase family protein [Actinophytocola xanthii]|uniref:Alkylhydroperoxidase n=1 Tax=Actinophytocola xanthii TaxID=1912961 RepID=A0A1Q8CUD2_9PSEU|nr:carboxymuconolactone decarboxylase family protein [Actinophytocola xanthii]OLF17962.1 alkylhydroperoxidase [Actinophytocola xanthii]
MFVDHTPETAPPAARRAMAATARRLGYLPAPVARMAAAPELLDGFLRLRDLFDATTLDPLARETLIMTIATRNGCHVCVAMHTAKLTALDADTALVAALRAGTALPESRLEALRRFTLDVLEHAGDVDAERLEAFLANGFTHRQALEVVLGIGTYTLSTLANRLTAAPLDEQLAPFAWHGAPPLTGPAR